MMDRWSEIDEALISSRPETPEDAVALLQVARDDYYQFNIETKDDPDQADQGERLVLSAFDNAIRVFRTASAPTTEASA